MIVIVAGLGNLPGVALSGMGLGIFIAKNLIENMGGKISFKNSIDQGAIVEIKLLNSIL